MFTGIIEELGKVAAIEKHAKGAKIEISAAKVVEDASEGDSIAVNGVCLTALDITSGSFTADVSQETLDRSTIGNLSAGAKVNLERAVTASTRLGGHIVQGHVDSTGVFLSAVSEGDFWTVRFGFPTEIGQYLIYKGSVSVEGISLTVATIAKDYFEIAVIPKTWEQTNLSSLKEGEAVNLEADVIAKYVERILLHRDESSLEEGVTLEKLGDSGFA